MLSTLDVTVRTGTFTFVTTESPLADATVHATVVEDEGVTSVISADDARRLGLEHDFVASWLTLTVHSSLDAVGLTASFATALASEGIACNTLAGTFHDHLLVPVDRADDAIAALRRISHEAG